MATSPNSQKFARDAVDNGFVIGHVPLRVLEHTKIVSNGGEVRRSLPLADRCLCLFRSISAQWSPQAKSEEKKEEQAYIRSLSRRQWYGTWCTMLRHNVFACARDTREGLRRPRFPTAARSGPHPALDPRNTSSEPREQPRRPRGVVGTATLSVFAPCPDSFMTAESGSSDRASTSEAASSGRTIIQHGASGLDTSPLFADQPKGLDAPNEDPGHHLPGGGFPTSLSGQLRRQHFMSVPEKNASIETDSVLHPDAPSVSSSEFSSNASSSRTLLARGPSIEPEARRQRESHSASGRGDRGAFRVMGVSGLFKRRPPTESAVPRRTEWRGDGRENPESSGVDGQAEFHTRVRSREDGTEGDPNRTGVLPRTSLAAWNLTANGTSGKSNVSFVGHLSVESSNTSIDEPKKFRVEDQRHGGAESEKEFSRDSSRLPWITRKVPLETDIPRRRSSSFGEIVADTPSSFGPTSDPEKGKPVNAISPLEVESHERELKATAFAQLQFIGAWDSEAGSVVVEHEAENLETGQPASALAPFQHAGASHSAAGDNRPDVESCSSNSVDVCGVESENNHDTSMESIDRSQEDDGDHEEQAAVEKVAVDRAEDLHVGQHRGQQKTTVETLTDEPIPRFSPRFSTARTSVGEATLLPEG